MLTGISTPEGVEVLKSCHMVPNEVLHVKVRPKLRTSIYSDANGHLDPHVRVSFAGPHTVSPSLRRSLSGSPLSSRIDHDADSETTADSEAMTSSTAPPPVYSKGKTTSDGVPIVSMPALRHRRVKRQQSVPVLPGGGDESSQKRSSLTGGNGSSTLTPPPPRKATKGMKLVTSPVAADQEKKPTFPADSPVAKQP